MIIITAIKKRTILIGVLVFLLLMSFGGYYYYLSIEAVPSIATTLEYQAFLYDLFRARNESILKQDVKTIESLYDHSTKYGRWAFEHQTIKMKYLHQWAEKQGVVFTEISSYLDIKSLKKRSNGYRSYFMVSTTYTYHYLNEPDVDNFFRIGTYHSLNTITRNDNVIINLEWYEDPFADSLNLDDIKKEEFKLVILKSSPKDYSDLNIRRLSAIDYADKYCGTASSPKIGFLYNPKYRDYNPLGGDCANYASQVLHEGGSFKKSGLWNYQKDGSKAWVNAQAFKNYLIYSGRGSIIASGSYQKVFTLSFKLLPGDIVAYEKKGKVKHVSVVSGSDSKGYTLVNCHNIDRYHVPWDLGWSDKGIVFHLIRVHY